MRRRDLLKTALLGGAAAMTGGLGPGLLRAADAADARPLIDPDQGGDFPWSGRVRNIIFFAYDGTGYENAAAAGYFSRSEEHTSELQSRGHLVCRLLLEKK